LALRGITYICASLTAIPIARGSTFSSFSFSFLHAGRNNASKENSLHETPPTLPKILSKKLSVLEAFAPGELSQKVFANLSEQVASEIGWNISEVLEQLGFGMALVFSSRIRRKYSSLGSTPSNSVLLPRWLHRRFGSLNRISTDIMVTRIDFSWICSRMGD
jgi:AraC-like DNA-binding protein